MDNTSANRPSPKLVALSAVLLLSLCVAGLFLLSKWRSHHIVVYTISYVVTALSERSGVSRFLIEGLVIIVTIPFFVAVAKYTHGLLWLHGVTPSLKLYRNPYGIVIVSYVGLFFIAMYFASLHAYAYKWCADTPEGIRAFDGPGIDPVYGIPTKPCSDTQKILLRQKEIGFAGPQRIQVENVRDFSFFDATTGSPRVWYHKLPDGAYAFYDKPGKYPGSGEDLLPIDNATIQAAGRLQDAARGQAKREASETANALYIDRSVASGRANDVAVLVFTGGNDEVPAAIASTVASAVSEHGFTAVLNFFKPAFVSEGLAQQLFAGNGAVLQSLDVERSVKYVILGQSSEKFESSSQFEGLITSNVSLNLRCIDTSTHGVCGSRTIDATGAGYSKDGSVGNAIAKMQPDLKAFVHTIRQ